LSRISELKQSISQKNPRFEDQYLYNHRRLGEGSFATVYACVKIGAKRLDKDTEGFPVCVKVFDRKARKGLRKEFRGEVELLRLITPNQYCVQMIDAFESRKSCHIVLEMCGMSLYDVFVRCFSREINELDLAHLFKCMLKGVEHLHECGLVHRDLKPANLLLAHGSSDNLSSRPLLKICDLGLASKMPARGLTEVCGTAPYMAPEMLLRKKAYHQQVDIWSTGVTAYLILFGSYPYKDKCSDAHQVKEAIKNDHNAPTFQARSGFAQPSETATAFVKSLLQREPVRRPDATRALSSQYISQLSMSSLDQQNLPCFGKTLSHVSEVMRDEPGVVRDFTDGSSTQDGSISDSTNCGQSSDEGRRSSLSSDGSLTTAL